MSKRNLPAKHFVFTAFFAAVFLGSPCLAQQPRILPGDGFGTGNHQKKIKNLEAELSRIDVQIGTLEYMLKQYIVFYTALDKLGAERENRSMYSSDINLSDDWVRYSAARLLTLPDPYDFSALPDQDPLFEPPLSLYGGDIKITSQKNANAYYSPLGNRIPGILSEIRQLDEKRLKLEAERTYLNGKTEPLTQGPATGSRLGSGHANADKLVAEGMQLLSQKDYLAARERFENALAINPKHARAFFGRGYVTYYEWGDLFGRETLETAIPDFDRALSLDPGLFEAQYMRGKVRMELGLFWEAVRDFQAACDGADASACNDLRKLAIEKENEGIIYWELGQVDMANRLFSEAIDIDFRYPDGWFNRALTWDKMGNNSRVIEDFGNYILHHQNAAAYAKARPIPLPEPNEALIVEATFRIGRAYFLMGKYVQALEYISRAKERAYVADPSAVAPCIHWEGTVHKKRGHLQQASTSFEEACRMGYQDACKARDSIRRSGQ